MKVVNKEEMKSIELRSLEDFMLDEGTIIENVGLSFVRQLEKDFLGQELRPDNLPTNLTSCEFLFLIGPGNNGADGLSAARHMSNLGYQVFAFVFADSPQDLTAACSQQFHMAQRFGVRLAYIHNIDEITSFFQHRQHLPIVIDALYGTGLRLPLSQQLYDVIDFINQNNSYLIAIDIATGVDIDTGNVVGNSIRADVTYAVGLPKVGCFLNHGVTYSGVIRTLYGGFPYELLQSQGDKWHIDVKEIAQYVKNRTRFGDKKVFGHIMLLGGSHGLTGALVLASQAALKMGAGLVTGATWESQYHEFIARLEPEIMTGYIPSDEGQWDALTKKFHRYDCMVIGPGMGESELSRRAVETILANYQGPVVLDADGINVLSGHNSSHFIQGREYPTILTPHFGEFARFMGVSIDEVREKTLELLAKCVESLGCWIVLKGPCTYMAFPSGKIYFNFSPNDGMSTGGTGDVLAGILGGLLGQDHSLKKSDRNYRNTLSVDKTIIQGVYLHSRAGAYAAKNLGSRAMVASSLIDFLPHAFEELEKNME